MTRFVVHRRMPEWGVCVVVRDIPPKNVEVLFSEGGLRTLARERADLEDVDDSEVPTDSPLRDPTRFPEVANKVAATASFESMLAEFRRIYRLGFDDPRYREAERVYKEQACDYARRALAPTRLRDLSARGAHADVFRAAMDCVQRTNLVFTNEKIKLRALPAEAHPDFANLLVDMLEATADYAVKMERFADFLADYEAGKWTIASYFGFLMSPDAHVFVKPTAVQRAAKALCQELQYEPRPNARTYERILALYATTRERLIGASLSPRDTIDVQGFLWIGTGMARELVA